MAECDLCSVSTSKWKRYSAKRVQEAVDAGLRPRGMAAKYNLAVGADVTAGWVEMVKADTSDWGLCDLCAEALESCLGHVRTFHAQTEDEAWAAAEAAGMPRDSVLRIRVTREVQSRKAEGMGPDAERAIADAARRIPREAFDVGMAETICTAATGQIEVRAASAAEACATAPEHAYLEGVECQVEPQKGILGIGGKPGVWVFSWTRPFRVRIAYKLPAEVTLTYTEDEALAVTSKE